jgi:hypothetical protein
VRINSFTTALAKQGRVARLIADGWLDTPQMPDGSFENQNNRSLVTRVDFGQSAFLFMGDLETDGIETLLDFYGETASGMLNVDVVQVMGLCQLRHRGIAGALARGTGRLQFVGLSHQYLHLSSLVGTS